MESICAPIVIGAGPAGLTAALSLAKRGVTPHLMEASNSVGGLARTPRVGDWRVDPGGHRFFTRHEEVLELWRSLLPADQWISVPRRSAMLVDDHYVPYPLIGRDLLFQMGFRRGLRGLSSFSWSRAQRAMRAVEDSANFREWGTDQFGRYWYDMFFDGYVRKTWLTDPADVTSDWARQRIKPIGWRAPKTRHPPEEEILDPVLGPGQLWDAAAARLAESGVVPRLESRVVKVWFDGTRWTVELESGQTASGDAVFASMPLRLLVNALEPEPPRHIRTVAAELKHRALITVAVALRKHYDIPFNWVYTPQAGVKVGRIQNYGLWSEGLAPDGWQGTYLGLEYYIGPTDDVYAMDDESLRHVVAEDLRVLGLDDSTVEHVTVVRSPYAYPICDPARDRSVARIRRYLRREYPSLHPIGRNGMHHYDNQDHAMLTAMQSVGRYFGENVDPWQVNVDRGYHEAGLLER